MHEHLYYWAIASYEYKIGLLILSWVAVYALILIPFSLARWIVRKADCYLQKSRNNEQRREFIFSMLDFFKNVGPGVSAYSVVGMIVHKGYAGSVIDLMLVFLLGIMVTEMARNTKMSYVQKYLRDTK